jgi:hypothetical protein
MLSRGFKDQIYDVYRYLPPDLQVLLTFISWYLNKYDKTKLKCTGIDS